MQLALRRRWKNLAKERIENVRPSIPRGDNFWEPTREEIRALTRLVQTPDLRRLVTSLHSRDDDAPVKLLDAAYWVKGCSPLGRLRYAVLVGVKNDKKKDIAFLDIKEAATTAAPHAANAAMPRDNAERVVEGARSIAPNLGDRMLPAQLGARSVVARELLPQDLKLEIDQLTKNEAIYAARYLAHVVGRAHARPDGRHYTTQMAFNTRARPVQKISMHLLGFGAALWNSWAPTRSLISNIAVGTLCRGNGADRKQGHSSGVDEPKPIPFALHQ